LSGSINKTLPVSNCNSQRFYGTYSLIQLFDSYNEITSEVINKILVNQKVFIIQEELDRLKGIPGVKFDLPLNDETSRAFIALVGRQRSQKSGVYIFTHKESGSKYVGSSNNLFFRLFDYFRHDAKSDYTGLLLPMLRKQGLGAFSLEIFIIPAEFSPNSYLYLEQYHLLNKKFDLNTQRTVQFRALRPHKIYLYDSEGKILYYSCDSYSKLQKDLGIHYTTFKKCLQQGNKYLNFFKVTDTLIEDGKNSVATAGLNLIELNGLIAEKQALNRFNNVKDSRATKSKSITVKEDITGVTMDFPNILAAVSYLESKNNKVNRNTIAKYLNTGKPFKGYLFNETKDKKVKKVEVYDSNQNLIELCNSLKEASEKYGVSVISLRLSSYSDKLFKGKYYFKKRPLEVTNKKERKYSTSSRSASQEAYTYKPFIMPLSVSNSILVSLSNSIYLKSMDRIINRIICVLFLGVYSYFNGTAGFVGLDFSLSECILYLLILINNIFLLLQYSTPIKSFYKNNPKLFTLKTYYLIKLDKSFSLFGLYYVMLVGFYILIGA
jgi:hypothetical protein